MDIFAPDPSRAIVKKDGKMHDTFRIFTLLLSHLGIAFGSGSPEGILEADQTKLYMDTTGTAGNILYIKRDSDIGGDKNQGWILV